MTSILRIGRFCLDKTVALKSLAPKRQPGGIHAFWTLKM
jgi:hypothetical protein